MRGGKKISTHAILDGVLNAIQLHEIAELIRIVFFKINVLKT